MSETTQILFNSPALHSLKRDQLVKLCKIHSIKANGKNVELIERLKSHALTLPSNAPLSVAMRSENPPVDMEEDISMTERSSSFTRSGMPRPSEQWGAVMDDIKESPEESGSQGTLSSLRTIPGTPGDFGTGSSKTSSVSSSIKAFANSLGFTHALSTKSTTTSTSASSLPVAGDELSLRSARYSKLPETRLSQLPLADHFTLSTGDASMDEADPLPGEAGRAGKPAPMNSRLSAGAGAASGPTTTIRLVSATSSSSFSSLVPGEPDTPQLKPFATSFDLLLGSPGAGGQASVPVWPLSPGRGATERLYPILPTEELVSGGTWTPAKAIAAKSQTPASLRRPSNDVQDMFSPAKGDLEAPPSQPFVFGSPLPQHNVSNKAFGSAAASVLEEMNRRLSAVGGQKLSSDILKRDSNVSLGPSATRASSGNVNNKSDRYERTHEEQFSKMDSIANHYAARRPEPATKKRKSDALGRGVPLGKKRASAGTQAIDNGGRKRIIPGGFGDEEGEDDEDAVDAEANRRMSKRIRVEEGDGGLNKGRRISLLSPSSALSEKDEKKKEKEREATKRMLDQRKEKRRSSRVSGAVPQAKSKGTTSRFGFFSSAKSVVRNVWNMSTKATPAKKADLTKAATDAKKPSLPTSHSSTVKGSTNRVASGSSIASGRSSLLKTTGGFKPNPGSRSPLPPFSSASNRISATPAGRSRSGSVTSVAGERTSGNMGPSSSIGSRISTRASGAPSQPSAGSKVSATQTSTANASSVDSRKSVASSARAGSIGSTSSRAPPRRLGSVSSRLLAPTASSLAKTRSPFKGMQDHSGSARSPQANRVSALGQITNSPGQSPRKGVAGKIFSSPFSPSTIPSPVEPTSFGAAALALAAAAKPAAHKPTALAARKPRISRSRVIAKLGAQRAAAAAASAAAAGSPKATPRTRSSVGDGVRRSYGKGNARGSDVVLSAKKRVRQSEYARRKSRAGGSAVSAGLFANRGGTAMDVDDD